MRGSISDHPHQDLILSENRLLSRDDRALIALKYNMVFLATIKSGRIKTKPNEMKLSENKTSKLHKLEAHFFY